jgi:hypothetical protein
LIKSHQKNCLSSVWACQSDLGRQPGRWNYKKIKGGDDHIQEKGMGGRLETDLDFGDESLHYFVFVHTLDQVLKDKDTKRRRVENRQQEEGFKHLLVLGL